MNLSVILYKFLFCKNCLAYNLWTFLDNPSWVLSFYMQIDQPIQIMTTNQCWISSRSADLVQQTRRSFWLLTHFLIWYSLAKLTFRSSWGQNLLFLYFYYIIDFVILLCVQMNIYSSENLESNDKPNGAEEKKKKLNLSILPRDIQLQIRRCSIWTNLAKKEMYWLI